MTKLEFRGDKSISIPERVMDILKTHDAIEFDFKGNRFAIITFEDHVLLLKKWNSK